MKADLDLVPVRQPKSYTGAGRSLGYLAAAVETNEVRVTDDIAGTRVTFTNGILSAQWLLHAIDPVKSKRIADRAPGTRSLRPKHQSSYAHRLPQSDRF